MRSFPLTEADLSQNNLKRDKVRYHGPSMYPTFKPGQVLYLRPESHGVEPGDVVVYRCGNTYIVHRVQLVQQEGFSTRGDNNPRADEAPIPQEEIIGVVDKVDDWGKLHPVTGGKRGLWQARMRWETKSLYHSLLPWLGAPYRWLKKRGWIRKLWHPPVERVHFQTLTGPIVKYISRGKIVAIWQPESSSFTCRRPYDLVIDVPLNKTL